MMEFDKKIYSLNVGSFIFFSSFKISFINSSQNSNGDFLLLVLAFDGSG